jgi:hypothetical protein
VPTCGRFTLKRWIVLGCLVVLCGCKVERTGHDTYKVAPTRQLKAAERQVRADASELGAKIKEGARHAGSELKKAGEKAESHTSTETKDATSSDERSATSTTETRTHVSRRH